MLIFTLTFLNWKKNLIIIFNLLYPSTMHRSGIYILEIFTKKQGSIKREEWGERKKEEKREVNWKKGKKGNNILNFVFLLNIGPYDHQKSPQKNRGEYFSA